MPTSLSVEHIQSCIRFVRGFPVLALADVARFYDSPSNQLQFHASYMPGEFCFKLDDAEIASFGRTSPSRTSPGLALTEHGALAAAYILGEPRAIETSVQVIRAFLRYREMPMRRTAARAMAF